MSEPRLPFFVYGTLRPNCGNFSWALNGKTKRATADLPTATLKTATMYGHRGFPYILLEDTGNQVVGTICDVKDSYYDSVLKDLDGLEGYFGPGNSMNHYDRVIQTVRMADGTDVSVYVYVASGRTAESVRTNHPVIPSGDWVEHTGVTLPLPGEDDADDIDEWWLNYRK